MHGWLWITRSTRRVAPYWFCTRCGATRDEKKKADPLEPAHKNSGT